MGTLNLQKLLKRTKPQAKAKKPVDPSIVMKQRGELTECGKIPYHLFISDVREKLGVSGTDLCKALGYDKSVLSQYEHGKRIPKPESIAKIYKELGVEVSVRYEVVFRKIEKENTEKDSPVE